MARAIVEALPLSAPRRGLAEAPFRLLGVCGRDHIALLRESLRSVAHSWERLPELLVVSDGSMTAAELRDALSWWPATLLTRDRDEVARLSRRLAAPRVNDFAECSGFGAKFAAIVTSALERPTLFADADILWFRDFSRAITALMKRGGRPILQVAEDYQPAYDPEVLAACGTSLSDPPFVNTGVVFLEGDLLSSVDLADGLIAAARRPHAFAEQTLLAVASRRLRSPLFDPSDIACFATDNMSLRLTYRGAPWTARHYVGPVRHLFWRDALGLRLGISA